MNRKNSIQGILLLFALLIPVQLCALVKSPPEKAILPNGLRVIVVEDTSLPIAAAGLIFDSVPYYMQQDNSGLGRIYSSMMRHSSFANESRYDFNARLESAGVLTEFGGGRDQFYAACHGGSENVEVMMEALRKIGFNLKPVENEFNRAKEETLRFVQTSSRFPLTTGLLQRQLWRDLYSDNASACLGPIGPERLARSEFSNLDDFVSSIFVPNNAVLVVVGDVKASHVFKQSMKIFGEQTAATVANKTIAAVDAETKVRKSQKTEYFNIEETQVLIGFEAPAFSDREMPVAMLWQAALHEINNSWVEYSLKKNFPDLRDPFALYVPGIDRGIFVVGFSSREADVNRPINHILSALSNIHFAPPRGGELQKIVEIMQLKELSRKESRLQRVFDLGRSEIMGSMGISEAITSSYNRVTPADMTRVARDMFNQGRYAIRIAQPLKMQKAVAVPVRTKTLDNGARIIVRNFPGSEIVGLTMSLSVDSCEEDQKMRSLSRMVAEMVADFINDKENRRLSNKLDDIGARLGAVFFNDSLIISARTQQQKLPELLVFLGEMIRNPWYSDRFFDRARQRVLQKHEEDFTNPQMIMMREMYEGLYPGMHLMLQDFNKAELEAISYKEIEEFYSNWAVASNLVVGVVGNFDSERILNKVAQAFAKLPKGEGVVSSVCPVWAGEPLPETIVKKVSLPANQEYAYISVGFRMPQFLHLDDKAELYTNFGANTVFSHILFASSNALIARELEEIDAYRGLDGAYQSNRLISVLAFTAVVPVEKVDQARSVIEKIIKQIPQMQISQKEIHATGQNLQAYFNSVLEKSDAQSNMLANFMANGLKEDFFEEILGVFNSITHDQIRQGAKNNFNNYLMLIGTPARQ